MPNDTDEVRYVVLATDYPLLQVFWTILIFFSWVIWIWMAVVVLTDIFRRHDLSGWGKAAWTVFVIVLPFVGVLTYLIANSSEMAERRNKDAQAAQGDFDDYVRSVSNGKNGAASQIERAHKLLDSGAISQAEYEQLKAKALA